MNGSSPLTRGKHPAKDKARLIRRLIPAHAGKTRGTRVLCAVPTAHPRSRGENSLPFPFPLPSLGSSPLTRGKRPAHDVTHITKRLIPAHAGKTLGQPGSTSSRPAHPRSRGENWWFRCGRCSRGGSSPLTRGKPFNRVYSIEDARLIPAHAGKTGCRLARGTGGRAHPRSRGENKVVPGTRWYQNGSSPLTRGKRYYAATATGGERLIPAHAGKTYQSVNWSRGT